MVCGMKYMLRALSLKNKNNKHRREQHLYLKRNDTQHIIATLTAYTDKHAKDTLTSSLRSGLLAC